MKPLGAIIRPRLTAEYRRALEEIRDGVDVVSPLLARTLRDIQLKCPELLTIRPSTTPHSVAAVRPYFHAALSDAGVIALTPAPRKKGGAQ